MTGTLNIALLRGVNVGGVTVTSAQLAEVFRGLGYTDVKTVLASGNVLFSGPGSPKEQAAAIEQVLSDEFGYPARVVVTDQAAVRTVVDAYPFPEVDDRQPYVVFLGDPADLATLAEAGGDIDDTVERVQPGHDVLYWEVRRGMSTDSAFSKRSTKMRSILTTTRNLRTLRKLL